MVELKTPGEIDAMAAAGRSSPARSPRSDQAAQVGTRLDALDQVARQVLRDAGASSPFLGYHPSFGGSPFPGVVCLSVNDAVLHGLPTATGCATATCSASTAAPPSTAGPGDAAISFCVGPTSDADTHLLEQTRDALARGIAAAQPGARIGDISAAIGAGRAGRRPRVAHRLRRARNRPHHAREPALPNDGRAGRGLRLQPGLTIAIEPWFLAGGLDAYRFDPDGWTLRSTDGSRGAHFEHTIAVTESGPRILTVAP